MMRIHSVTFTIIAGVAAAAASGVSVLSTQQMPIAQAFTAAQATEGKAAYATRCASCHMPDLSGNNDVPPLAGANFLSTWGTRSTKDLFGYTMDAMPPGGPALPLDVGAAIVAHILKVNGAEEGERALSPSTAMLIGTLTTASRAGAGEVGGR